jgi:hypothetical protein
VSRPSQCPRCGSGRLWNLRLLRILLAVILAILGAVNVIEFATQGLGWRDAMSGFVFAALAGMFGLMAGQNPPRYCRSCRARF